MFTKKGARAHERRGHMNDGSSSSDDSDELLGTHISDDEAPRSRRDKVLRAKDPEKQAKFKHAHQTEVTDAQGRVRFHGAFTGGFSAGYYNTVGSEEGWEPSQWRSSREGPGPTERIASRPEDFMDAEDLAERRDIEALVARPGFGKPSAPTDSHRRSGADSDAASGGGGGRPDCSSHGGSSSRVCAALADLLTVCSSCLPSPPRCARTPAARVPAPSPNLQPRSLSERGGDSSSTY